MNSYVGMTMVKKNRDKMIISINKAYFSHYNNNTLHAIMSNYHRRGNFCGRNISWVKFSRD